MYSAEFDYHRARSVQDAQELLARHPGAKLLAGGHSLLPLLKLRLAAPDTVIDIGRIAELRGITLSGDALRIGALMTHAQIAGSADVRRHAQALAEAAALVGDPTVRNRGTIGGNVAHADPASDLPTVLVALAARLLAIGPAGERAIEADRFFTGMMSTALREDEILTDVVVPRALPGQASAYVKFAHPASRYAVVGVAASVTGEKGVCTAVSVAIGGLVPFPRRAGEVERSLTGQQPSADAIATAAEQLSLAIDDVIGDIYASAEYRRKVAPVFVKRALTMAVARAGLS